MAEQKSSQQPAVEKLQGELNKAGTNKNFAEPIIEHLIKRCGEDPGMAEDVLKEKRTWGACENYIYAQAKKAAGNRNQIAIRNDQVFEWAEDYYRMDDKAAEEWEKKSAPKVRMAKPVKPKTEKKNAQKSTDTVSERTEEKGKTTETDTKSESAGSKNQSTEVKKEAKPKARKKDGGMDGQMSLFDLM